MKNKNRLSEFIKPERYKITLKPDLNEFTFTGEETIFLNLEKPAKQITLHAVELEIESAEWIHQNQEVWAGKISYDAKSETATFTFPKPIQKGVGQMKLAFKGILNDKMRGFYRSKYEVDGVSKHLATTQFESTDARRAFPCFDEPSQKSVFEVTLKVPIGTTAISNTMESNISEHESGYKLVEFAPTPKMSTYLLAFIVGDFEYLEGKSGNGKLIRVFTAPGKKQQAKFALEVGIKCLDFYENYFKIPYPLPVLDMIAIPDFAAGAMENWGAVTYRESRLLIDEATSSTANKQWTALVIAHELAHQWFGNLVTMEWWTHLWLNEGFASYIEYLAIDHIFPEWNVWTQFVGTELSDAFSLDALKNTHPIEVEVSNPAEISEIFDAVSYSKGASVIRMLAEYLGPKDFQKGLQLYLKRHSYGNAQTTDLWKALEDVSEKPVLKIMKNWTGKAGHPVVIAKFKVQSSKLELTQSRFFSSPISLRQTKDTTIWNIPIRMGREQFLMDKKLMDIPNTGEKLNKEEVSLVRFNYSTEYMKNLEKAVKTGKLSASDRLGLVRDSFDLAQAGDSSTVQALEFAQSLVNETDYTVWAEVTGHLSQLDDLLAYESFHEDFKKYGRQIYSGIAQKIGWEAKVGEKHTNGLLRGMVQYKLGSFGDKDTIKKAQELFTLQMSLRDHEVAKQSRYDINPSQIASSKTPRNDKGIDPDLRGVVYNLVAENGNLQEFNTLVKMYKDEQNPQEKERIGRSLGVFQSKIILQKALDFSLSKHVRFQNSLQIIAFVWNNPEGRYLAWEFVKKNWELLKDRYAGGHYFTKVFPPMGNFTKISDAKEIEQFIKKHPVPEAKRTIAQALEQIYSNAEWLKRDREKIKKFLQR